MATSTGGKINYLHFLLSLDEANDCLSQRVSGFRVDKQWVSNLVILVVAAVLDKEALVESGHKDAFADAIDELEYSGLAKQNAHETVNELFDIIAAAVVDAIPDFGDDRYRGKYEYEIRGSLVLHLVVHAHSFG